MLPSRIFRNIGLSLPLRSFSTPYSSLRATVRLRQGVQPNPFPCRSPYSTAPALPQPNPNADSSAAEAPRIQPRLSITFTCTAGDCTTRSTHEFSKHAYEKGIVLVQCPGCHTRHLIADHIGWFKESTEEGKLRTVEDLLRARGETVKRGALDADGGVVEYTP